ncbi:putative D,D-dipeptide transport system permease protein DdpB [Microbacterium lemovicicum]|uniref:Putative D,D-dipeptide transport system permease protein DdpB n=1 Tax=Microbacterium lemovicicum TaxID=1072463 RepID=A0A3S9WCU5_9MICO|nr:ABC transporter permease [Microbacterium lemovicicum]AZS37840.1 putative D,D-dipeptide transport system permease protein DdpB [Microbacterium lemovicicum]
MTLFILKRVGASALLVIGTVLVAFALTAVLPGDAATARLGERAAADPALVAAMRERMGLNRPLYEQFFIYLGGLFRGDLGESTQTSRPVLSDLQLFGPASAELALTATLIAVIVGGGLGIVAALRANGHLDNILRAVSLTGVSVPIFWFALIATAIFSTQLRWFPSSGRLDAGAIPPPRITGFFTIDSLLAGNLPLLGEAVQHLILPAIVLSAPMVGLLMRFTRASVLDVLGMEYIRAAEAKGLSGPSVVFGHVLRGALVPVITVVGTAFASLLAGTVLVEQIFAWPGIGSYAYRAASTLDLSAIVGVTIFVALIYIVVNLATDILYGIIDPRIRRA